MNKKIESLGDVGHVVHFKEVVGWSKNNFVDASTTIQCLEFSTNLWSYEQLAYHSYRNNLLQ